MVEGRQYLYVWTAKNEKLYDDDDDDTLTEKGSISSSQYFVYKYIGFLYFGHFLYQQKHDYVKKNEFVSIFMMALTYAFIFTR